MTVMTSIEQAAEPLDPKRSEVEGMHMQNSEIPIKPLSIRRLFQEFFSPIAWVDDPQVVHTHTHVPVALAWVK